MMPAALTQRQADGGRSAESPTRPVRRHDHAAAHDRPAIDRPLRIGVMLDSTRAPAWVARTIRDIAAGPDCDLSLVIVDASAGERPRPRSWREWFERQREALPYRMWEWYQASDYERFRHEGDDPFAPVDVAPILGTTPVLAASPVRTRFVDRFRAEDLERIAQADLDVLVRFGFRIIKGEILAAARYGVWSIHHGDNRQYRGGPALFWEIFEGNFESGSILQVLTDTLDGGRVIYRSTSATEFGSLYKNRRETYWKTAAFIGRRLADLKREGWEYLQSLDTYQEADTYGRAIFRRPTNRQMLRFLARTWSYRLKCKVLERFDRQWIIGYRTRMPRDDAPFTILEPPPGRFYADPCLVDDAEHTYLFFEDCPLDPGHGVISCARIEPDGRTGPVEVVLESACHLSYPFVFRWRDAWWMIPETGQRRTVELYRAHAFPRDWRLEATLLQGVDARDATLVEWDGRWWMFAATRVPGSTGSDEVSLYYADSPLGPWSPHAGNPVVSNVRSARPAGAIRRENGVLVRPAQDCSRGYGYAVTLNRIDCLTEREYRETPAGSVQPDWHRGIEATHTVTRSERYEARDGRWLRRRRRA